MKVWVRDTEHKSRSHGRLHLVGPYLWGSFCLRRLELQRMSVSNETRPPENLQVTHLHLGRQYDSLSYSIWPISPCFQKIYSLGPWTNLCDVLADIVASRFQSPANSGWPLFSDDRLSDWHVHHQLDRAFLLSHSQHPSDRILSTCAVRDWHVDTVIENWIDQDFGAKARMAFLVRQDPLDWLFRVALISTPYRSRVCSLPSTERSAVQMNLTIFNPDSPEFIRTPGHAF
jgi:hypothetical protein